MQEGKQMKRLPELLAPAGGPDRLEMAVRFGADSVYLGANRFGLRSFADNFTDEELEWAVRFAHSHGKRVYLTANAYAVNGDIGPLHDFFQMVEAIGVDAAIVADAGVLAVAKRSAPKLKLHLSTQANVSNYESARFYHEAGVDRIVLAREMSLEEIGELRAKTPASLELEAFVHGAMCLSMSGRCYLSAYLNERSANRGQCTQPCRWEFALSRRNQEGEYLLLDEDDRGTYILNSKDLNMLAYLGQLIDTGIDSLKIEGRMKTVYYVASVVNAYRRALDRYVAGDERTDDLLRQLDMVAGRGYHTGFYFRQPQQMTESSQSKGEGEFSGVVRDWSDGWATVEVRNKISLGDELHILSPDTDGAVKVERIVDPDKGELPCANIPMRQVKIPISRALMQNDILYKVIEG